MTIKTIKDLMPDSHNANKGTVRGAKMIEASLQQDGFGRPVLVDKNGQLIAGNKTVQGVADTFGIDTEVVLVKTTGNKVIVHQREDLDLESDDLNNPARRLAYRDNLAGHFSFELSPEVVLADFEGGFDFDDIGVRVEDLAVLLPDVTEFGENGGGEDTEAQIDKAEELREEWGVELGQLWQLGEHRLICGDCTDAAVVERVMGGEKAVLSHADPPYGMGKENEGITNDNLYREKLDAFQMKWWGVGRQFLEDNGSAYIWGNAEDLWRLWYKGGLKDSERLTFRNEIVWDKQDGTNPTLRINGKNFEGQRSFYQSECVFFFMLGEQGFNNNADNYWEGWEKIRSALDADCNKMGWTADDIKRITGVGMYGHWFTKSQWTFIPEEHYKKLQAAAREHDAFKREHDDLKREHDDLKREFYSTRAYFDNTHENMTDVWQFQRVQGEERWEHATPKPVAMIERIVKSSSPSGAIVYSPFLGSGTDLIACENLSRRCRAAEIDPGYVGVCLQRFQDHTGKTPVLIES